jgi:putative hydrolase of the HAD superfamily
VSTSPFDFASVRAVFLDAVGTLLHPWPPAVWVYCATGARFGSRLSLAAVTTRFAAAFARQEEQDLAAGLRTDEAREVARWRAIVAAVLDDVSDPEACFRDLYHHFSRPSAWRVAPTAGVLEELAGRGFTLGIASNFDHRLRGLMAGLPELRPVHHLVISSEVGWRKPALEFFRAARDRGGVPPEQILFVGDDFANDYEGARAAGLRAVLLDPHGRCPEPPPARIQSLSELLQRLPRILRIEN